MGDLGGPGPDQFRPRGGTHLPVCSAGSNGNGKGEISVLERNRSTGAPRRGSRTSAPACG